MRVGAVVLAAGAGSRFGGGKLDALLWGKPILQHVTETLAQALVDGTLATGVVVLRPGDERGQQIAASQQLRAVMVADADLGLAQSLAAGLAALEDADLSAALVLLGDQPLVGVEQIAAVCRAAGSTSAPIVRPRYTDDPDVPGHPVLLRRELWPAVRPLQGDAVFARLREQFGEAHTIELPGSNPDVDTRDQLAPLSDLRRPPAFPGRPN